MSIARVVVERNVLAAYMTPKRGHHVEKRQLRICLPSDTIFVKTCSVSALAKRSTGARVLHET